MLCNDHLLKRSTGRPTYSHLVCYAKNPIITRPVIIDAGIDANCLEYTSHRTSYYAIPDIFYRGEMLWPKAIGLDCCYAGVIFLKEIAKSECLLDPFCGQGTTLVMANLLGMRAVGVEISNKRCRKARRLKIKPEMLERINPLLRNIRIEVLDERNEMREKASTEESDHEND